VKPFERQAILLPPRRTGGEEFRRIECARHARHGTRADAQPAPQQRVLGMLAGTLLRRQGDIDRRRDDRELAAGDIFFLYAQRADRRRRRDHPVERRARSPACGRSVRRSRPAAPVVLKPAERPPHPRLRLGELCMEAGVPAGVVNVVPGFGETAGAALASHPGVDKVALPART